LISKSIFSPVVVLILAFSAALSACGGPAVPISTTGVPALKGQAAGFDNVDIDQATHRLYLGDRTDKGVDVFDISTARAKYLQTIPMPASPNGLAVASELRRLFVGLGDGSVAVVDTNNGAVIANVKTGQKGADLLDFAAARQRLYVGNAVDGIITSIDAGTNAVKAHFIVGSTVEQPRYNPVDQMVYVTSPQADALLKIDPNDGLVKNKWPLGGCQPNGLAINPSSNKALIVCRTFVLSFDLATARTEKFTQVLGGDIVNYDPKADRFFVGSPHITKPSVVGIFGGNPIAYYTSVVTDAHGNSATYDETNGIVYTPDERPKKPGVASFKLPDKPLILPQWLSTTLTYGMYAGVLAVFAFLFFFVSRSADPARRPLPKVKPEPEVKAEEPAPVELKQRGSQIGPAT
jgi:DNA-binding beta-propeller fold protein YncE